VFRGDYLDSFGLDRICEELEAVTALAGEYQVPRELFDVVRRTYRRALARFGPADGELLAVSLLDDEAGCSAHSWQARPARLTPGRTKRRCLQMAATPGEAARPAGRTLVFLVRHGQTPLNESGALPGDASALDEAGHQQARRLAAALGPQMPRAVGASPRLRARQTAQPVAGRAGLDVATDERLLDRDYGQWTGATGESSRSVGLGR